VAELGELKSEIEVVMGDQLKRDERIRLEALAQAVQLNIGIAISDEQIVSIARKFEAWIKEGHG
jgi:hypothetical protein